MTTDSIGLKSIGSISADEPITVVFQTAFPYIGLSKDAFKELVVQINSLND